MAIMTFTSDWGMRDYHIGALKGQLLSAIPGLTIVDISHQVARHNIQQAAYIFSNAYRNFPAGSMHFIAVHSQGEFPGELLAVKKDGHTFLALNDGLLSLVFETPPVDMVAVRPLDDSGQRYDMPTIVNASLHLLGGKNLYELGARPESFIQRSAFQPAIDEELIHGVVIYIDDFGNIVTNITRTLFEERRGGRKFEIVARKSQHSIDTISRYYSDVEAGSALALFNDAGFLEIAINEGSAFQLMNLRLNDNIRIEFK